jgi:hypothetical protein
MVDFEKFIVKQCWKPTVKREARQHNDDFGPLTLAQWQEWAKRYGLIVLR